ncbi:MAG: Gfo/Idh/MocA family oxidoreductase [Acidobacteriia bacterium]|nr:Gfo/Idh/MocA family oxidoreductase [Terriglobia bacterium]
MGRVHLEALRRLGTVEAYLVNPRSEPDFRKALADPAVEAIHICTPNALHFPMAQAALEAGKHVLCEKPLATSVEDARKLTQLARARGRRNCTCHNLRYYPLVQQMRRMREDGDLGEILVVQGTYSQDWLLYDTDWNWRIDSRDNGPSRAWADIGSHWCDMAEHATGLRITALCADLQTFHQTRKRPMGSIETFAGKTHAPAESTEVSIDTEDFGAAIFRMGERTRGAFTASQVSAGRKNRLSLEIYGTKASVAWDQERPDELWVGRRNANNQVLVKDPALLHAGARPYADLPGGHSEGYDDTFKQTFRRFYQSIENPGAEPEYPQFADGLRQLIVLEAALESHRRRAWVEVAGEP